MSTQNALRAVVASATKKGAPDRAMDRRLPTTHYSRLWKRRARRSATLVFLLWASGLVAGALSLPTVFATQAANFAGVMTGTGIIVGLVGTDLILVMLVLAARIPAIDGAIGHDRAIAVHRSLGKPALYLILAHAILLLIGYGTSQGIDPVSEIWSMLAIPDLPLAFLALGGLIAVVVTSVVAVRRRFSYEGWHLIHLLSYAAVLVAVPHQLSVGGILAEGSIQRAYWISLYIFAFGAVIAFRFVEPAIASLRHRVVVDRVENLENGVTSIHLRGHNLTALGTRGGQYFIWRFWTAGTWWHAHPVSLSSPPTSDAARITVRAAGAGTTAIGRVRSGTRISFEGPYGLFTDLARTSPHLAVVAAGIGVTPVRAMLDDATFRPGEATVLLRASSMKGTALWDETIDVARSRGAEVFSMVGHRSAHGSGWLSEADARRGVSLSSVFPRLATSDLYVCGPSAWLDLVVRDAKAAGLPPHQIHAERFDW